MPRAEFEEKEYEIAFNIELAGRRGAVFSSGQVLEKIVGYDAAAAPDRASAVWRVLNVSRPKGLRLLQPHWQPGDLPEPGDLPQRPVSLLLQYKRPDYVMGAAGKQWRLWHEPYFRFFARPRHQHAVLRRLQRNLGMEAVVRYAAPAFWRRADLEQHHLRRKVIEATGFVSPTRLGGHVIWTYRRPGIDGLANPHGRSLPFESITQLAQSLQSIHETGTQLVVFGERPLAVHLRRLGEAARYRNPAIRKKTEQWLRNALLGGLGLTRDTLEHVADLAAITTLMAQLGGTWHVVSNVDELAS
jgi:hypothetical protein